MNPAKNENALIIFAKYPQPGKVKTRLAKSIGEESACRVYQFLVKEILNSLPEKAQPLIAFDPPEKNEECKLLWGSENTQIIFFPQVKGGLGERLHHAFEHCFQLGFKKVSAIGSDCVTISAKIYQESFRSLDSNQVVLGFAEDGGYYLIGLSEWLPEVFENRPWSTSELFQNTCTDLKSRGISYHCLKPLSDVDLLEDLPKLPAEILARLSLAVPEVLSHLDGTV